jgi:hypothetical protein
MPFSREVKIRRLDYRIPRFAPQSMGHPAALLVAGGSVLLPRKTRTVAACVGGWILLLVLVIYGPVLIGALSDPGIGVQVEGINYFADTLLFAGVILALASATPRSDVVGWASRPEAKETLSTLSSK